VIAITLMRIFRRGKALIIWTIRIARFRRNDPRQEKGCACV
jgi:hypothetical protein